VANEHHGAEKPELVTDAPALGNLVRRLRQTDQVAFDTESASFHRYVDRVYLIQISTARETTLHLEG
jgi:ribonuclease D